MKTTPKKPILMTFEDKLSLFYGELDLRVEANANRIMKAAINSLRLDGKDDENNTKDADHRK